MTTEQLETPTITRPPLRFNALELQRANADWGCNCGPSAFAACCHLTLPQARGYCATFKAKGHMNATDMHGALYAARMKMVTELADGGTEQDVYPVHGLCLVQFSGPWINSPKNPKWQYVHTHWIASKWLVDQRWIFDCNALAWLPQSEWLDRIVPLLVASDPLRDGDFWLKHSWEIRKDAGNRSRRKV